MGEYEYLYENNVDIMDVDEQKFYGGKSTKWIGSSKYSLRNTNPK